MRTAEQTRTEFLAKFDALLREFDATLVVDDHYRGYSDCGRDLRAIIEVSPTWDNFGNPTQEGVDIELGTYRDGGMKLTKEMNDEC